MISRPSGGPCSYETPMAGRPRTDLERRSRRGYREEPMTTIEEGARAGLHAVPDADAEPVYDPDELDAKTRNIIYHDWEATQYDDKWSISFDERCISYAKEKFAKVAPVRKYGKVLEIGCGTGFFIVNLWQAGLVRQAFATDISPGMVEVCQRNARNVGLKNLEGRAADAENLPYKTGSFDLVVGHAVLHHLPDVPASLAECYRVLKPGGALVIAG